MGAEDKLRELGIELPPVPMPLGSYVASVQTGNLVFVSGMLPLEVGILPRTGTVGAELSVEEAAHEARRAAINALSVLKAEIGNLDRVKRCVKITGYIASTGEAGRHARAAVGVPVLPLNSPIEIECIFEVIEKKEKARRK
jgi:enamine deaminase RidA (YjgF/YER057c/UK114 family)